MSIVIASMGALGLLFLYSGFTTPPGKLARPKTLDRFLSDAGMGVGGSRFLAVLIGTWFLAFVLAAGVTSSFTVSLATSVVGVWTPLAFLRARADNRRRRYGEAWPDAIATLIAAVRAGVSLPEACMALTLRGPEQLVPGFEAFTATYRATGNFSASLQRLRDVLSDPVADRVAVSLTLADEVGGTDLVRVLRVMGDFVREDLRVRREVEARWSWTVTAARVAAAAPWIVLLMMSTRPEAANAYDSTTGASVITIGALTTILGYRLMLRAARLPQEPRLPS